MEIRPPVPASEVASPDDRFRCEPYKSVLTVRACLSRQDVAALPANERREDYTYCPGCEIGATVRGRVLLPVEDMLTKRPMRRKTDRKPYQPNVQVAPSKATRAAIAALPAGLPMKPPAERPRTVRVPAPAPPPTPPVPAPYAAERAVLVDIESRIGALALRGGQLLAAVRSVRCRLAAR